MIKRIKVRPRLFYKYFLSYLLVFMIPYLTISIIFFQIAVGNLEKQIIRANINQIEQIRDITDSRLIELNNLATRISFDYRLTPYRLTQPYLDGQAIEELIRYKANSSFIDELFLHFQGNQELIYSTKGTSNFYTFINSNYKLDEENINKLKTGMQTKADPIIQTIDSASDNDKNHHLLAYTYPLPINSVSSYGSVTFLIKEATLSKLIQNALGDFEGNTFILNGQNDLLAVEGNGEMLDLDFVKNVSLTESGIISKELNNKNYSFSIVRSIISDWTFVTVLPTEQFYGKMTSLKNSIFIILLVIALIGIAVVCYSSFKHYKPIGHLAQFLRNKDRSETSNGKKSEIDLIRNRIESMYESSERLKKEIIAHKPFVKAQFLSSLLKGENSHQKLDQALVNELKIPFDGCAFFVVAVSYKGKIKTQDTIRQWELIVEMLEEISFQECNGYGVELTHDYTIAVIVMLKNGLKRTTKDNHYLFINELTNRLRNNCSVMPSVGIGKMYDGVQKINRSFIEAISSIENNLLNNSQNPVFFEEISEEHGKMVWFSEERKLKLIQSLKQGDYIVAKETLAEIFSTLVKTSKSNYLLKCTCYDIINSILKTSSELEIDLEADDIKSLSEFQSLEGLERSAVTIIKKVCTAVENKKESRNYRLRDNIMDYIQKQFKQHHLSLESVAEYFQISSSYLSRFIREQTGTTFTQFVWELRIKKFKDQLTNTTRPIKDIVKDVGYLDVSSFTRKFRKSEGLTPTEFRELHRQNSDGKKAL
ncbi:helix-turn-helix domain-containing protein [Bacillus niameyensis]|uniref:helix-turn-helix domain-containing protein n=1 Tax=Bacillus niameyensis TaxID=1522308 RepID=UPI000783DE38|nr:AraC family transcriptional regulator [Bacillus niameyensis]